MEKTERYEDCYEILNIAYDCAPIGRMIVYKMVEIAVKLKDFDEAVSCTRNLSESRLMIWDAMFEIRDLQGTRFLHRGSDCDS